MTTFITAVATKTNGHEEVLLYFRISTNVLAAPVGGFTVFARTTYAARVKQGAKAVAATPITGIAFNHSGKLFKIPILQGNDCYLCTALFTRLSRRLP